MSAVWSAPEGYMEIPERLNIADWCVTRNVREGRGGRLAIRCGGVSLSYSELEDEVNRGGHALQELGVERGEFFLIRGQNSLDYAIAIFAGMKIGAVPVPCSTLFRSYELEHILANSGCRVVLSDDQYLDDFRSALGTSGSNALLVRLGSRGADALDDTDSFRNVRAAQPPALEAADTHRDDPAYAIYTSGTTGKPKGVVHGHRIIIAGGHPVVYPYTGLSDSDICSIPLELSSMITLDLNLMFPMSVGASVVLYQGRFEPESFCKLVCDAGVTLISAVPTMLRRVLAIPDIEDRYDFSRVRMCIAGGESLPTATREAARERLGFDVFELIGQTESHIYITNMPSCTARPGSMGLPLPGRVPVVLDDDGREVPPGAVGEICLPSSDPALALTYRNMDEKWAGLHHDGWYRSGDLAYRDDDGYFYYVSRKDDLIISRAYRISPAEVEAVIVAHPGVIEVGVVGVSDAVIGQRVEAFVVLDSSVSGNEELASRIKAFVKSEIAPYKAPQVVHFVNELPKTPTGKVKRRELRGDLAKHSAA
jgi:acyl-coenzyme A synthetase/AMP-(fatty) acid ligase